MLYIWNQASFFFFGGLLAFLAPSYQAHYMLGLALLQREEYADGVKALQRVCILFSSV